MVTDKTYKKTPQEIDIEFGDLWKAMLKLRTRIAVLEEETEKLTKELKEAKQDLQAQIYRKV